MTQKEFRDLFDSVRCSEAFTEHMEKLLAEPPAGEFSESISGVSTVQKRTWMRYAGLAACLLIVTGGALFFLTRGSAPEQLPISTEVPAASTAAQMQETTTAPQETAAVTETVTETVIAVVTETTQTTTAETATETSTSTQTTAAQTSTITTDTVPPTETEETNAAPVLTGWQAAYLEIAEQFAGEYEEAKFSLIYFDDDDVPELAVSPFQTLLYLYTYDGGEAIELIDGWSFGVMGNTGYLYIPRMNSLQNYNHDFAGLLGYTTYMSITPQKTLEVTDVVETWNFNDLNGNGIPDEGEYDDELSYTAYYVDGVEITAEQAAAYAKGEYQPFSGELTLEKFKAELGLS